MKIEKNEWMNELRKEGRNKAGWEKIKQRINK